MGRAVAVVREVGSHSLVGEYDFNFFRFRYNPAFFKTHGDALHLTKGNISCDFEFTPVCLEPVTRTGIDGRQFRVIDPFHDPLPTLWQQIKFVRYTGKPLEMRLE